MKIRSIAGGEHRAERRQNTGCLKTRVPRRLSRLVEVSEFLRESHLDRTAKEEKESTEEELIPAGKKNRIPKSSAADTDVLGRWWKCHT